MVTNFTANMGSSGSILKINIVTRTLLPVKEVA